MADTVIIRIRAGSGDEGIALYEKANAMVMPVVRSRHPGLILHTCSKTDDGVVIVDVWEDGAMWQAMMADPEIASGFQEMGLPHPEVEIAPLHNTEQGQSFASL